MKELIASKLGDRLPQRMIPASPTGEYKRTNGTDLIAAAVLVPLINRDDEMTVLLTQRTDHLSAHAGQVSFPGGRMEAEDQSSVDAALRETEEEIGLDRRHIDVVGHLDICVTGTGYEVSPVVGLVEPPFNLTPDPNEVAHIFEVPLAFVLDPTNHRREVAHFPKHGRREFYVLPYLDWHIWGATARMLVNLSDLLKDGQS